MIETFDVNEYAILRPMLEVGLACSGWQLMSRTRC